MILYCCQKAIPRLIVWAAFYEGMPVSLYSDDASDSGEIDNLIFEGTAIKYDLKRYPEWRHVKWCARIDWNSLMHESDMNQSNSIE